MTATAPNASIEVHSATGNAAQHHRRLVAMYLIAACLLVLPAALARLSPPSLGLSPTTWTGPGSGEVFADIRFGSGVRFWLGVVGTALMAALLLYPLRKWAGRASWVGRVSLWFHLHLLAGIIAPVAIGYHANFGFGSTNANVALVAMCVVVASGLAGIYAYGGATRKLHGTGKIARQHRDYILSRLGVSVAGRREIAGLAGRFDLFEAGCLAPVDGIAAALIRRKRIDAAARDFWQDVLNVAARCDKACALDVTAAAANYLRLARRVAARAVVDQAWGWWRRFHAPVYVIMLVAVALHVAAVWQIDPSGTSEIETMIPRLASRPAAVEDLGPPPILVRAPAFAIRPAEARSRADVPPLTPARQASASPAPKIASPPRPAPKRAMEPVRAVPANAERQASTSPRTEATAAAAASSAIDDMDKVYAELGRRQVAPPMGLGHKTPASLAEQISAFKQRRAAGEFHHDESETGFTLTGKHRHVECSSCHAAPLTGKPSTAPRACIDCHRKDDVHKRRRPDCASCHTTDRWSEISRRR